MERGEKKKNANRSTNRQKGAGSSHQFLDVTTPASALETRKILRIQDSQIRNILRAFKAAGVEV